jgi:hypothetical protein
MSKKIILPAMIVCIVAACTTFISDGLTYLITSLMAIAIIATVQHNRSRVMKITRWAKANPLKAQLLITIIQILLMIFGIVAGYNFKKIGYELSGTTAFVFSTIMVTGFLSVHFLPKRSTIAIPAEVNKHRLIFVSIALSSFVLMVMTGNRIGEMYPNSFITRALEATDQAIFPDNATQYADRIDVALEPVNGENYTQALTANSTSSAAYTSFAANENETMEPPSYSKKESREKFKAEKKANRLEKKKAKMLKRVEKRLALAGVLTVGAVLLIILLSLTLCAGICLFIAGFSGSAALIPLGAVVAGGSIWGIIKVAKGNKRKNNL